MHFSEDIFMTLSLSEIVYGGYRRIALSKKVPELIFPVSFRFNPVAT